MADDKQSGTWPFLAGGGETAQLIARLDWSTTPLGPIAGWPPHLKTSISLVLRSPVPIVTLWGECGVMIYNDAYSVFAGARHPQLLGSNVREGWPEVADFNDNIMKVCLAGGTLAYRDLELTLFREGRPNQAWLDLDYSPILDEAGQPCAVMAIVIETTSKVRAQRHAGGERERLKQMFEQAPGFMAMLSGPDHVFDLVNPAYMQLVGHRDVVGKPLRQALPELEGQGYYELLDKVYATGETFFGTGMKAMLQTTPGAPAVERFVDLVYQPLRNDDGQVTGIFAQGTDVTDRIAAEEALRGSEAQFRTFAEAMPNQVWAAQPDGLLDWFNGRVSHYSGMPHETLQGNGWAGMVHTDDLPPALAKWTHALGSGETYETEFRLRDANGNFRWHIARALPIRDDARSIIRWVGSNTDIEEQKANAQALAHLNQTLEQRVAERTASLQKTEAALQQAQKMETVGQLTGGVAHDFNNLLQVISGNLQLLMREVSGNPRAERQVANALAASGRGAKLSSQLLAFARRQPLEPRVVRLGRLVTGMDEMLRRSLGDSIEVETIVSGGLWNTFADPTQLENVLLNLAINARDAMAGVGRLTIEAGNAHLDDAYAAEHPDVLPGQYVILAVTDTGSGMPPEIIEKAFEPFFSTKPEGKGTGLGLSMVYGFVKQSGGHVKIYSEVGHGTSVKLYLPRTLADEDTAAPQAAASAIGGTETILVAEDDDQVRDTVVAMLGELGYHVLTARDATSALAIVQGGAPVDVLFTDVVMPGPLRSPDLARQAKALLPDLAVLFTSGYTQNAIVHGGRLDPGVELLGKPYSQEALARKIRHVIANQRQREAGRTGHGRSTPSPQAAPQGMQVLLVEDDELVRSSTAELLAYLGHVVRTAAHATEALTALNQMRFDVLMTDVGLPDMSGEALAAIARRSHPAMGVVFATGARLAVQPARTVALLKPYDAGTIGQALVDAVNAAAGDAQPVFRAPT